MRSMLAGIGIVLLTGSCTLWQFPVDDEVSHPQTVLHFSEHSRRFSFLLESDPPDVIVAIRQDGKVRNLGKTPFNISIQFEKKPRDNLLGRIGFTEWKPSSFHNQPYEVIRDGHNFIIRIKNLILQKEGYQDESFSDEWVISRSLSIPIGVFRKDTTSLLKEARVVMREPTQPQFEREVILQNISGYGTIHFLTPDKAAGHVVGEFPLSMKIGLAPRRNKAGEIIGWQLWTSKSNQSLWTITAKGEMFLSFVFLQEGYEPEIVDRFFVANADRNMPDPIIVRVRPCSPTAPQVDIDVTIDSLPTGADIYSLRDDGLLGQKLGQTPLNFKIGVAQKLKYDKSGYRHEEWLGWGPAELVEMKTNVDGSANLFLGFALFKEGFAVEKVKQTAVILQPGHRIPPSTTLTIPLLQPEIAAERERRKNVAPPPVQYLRDNISQGLTVWEAPVPSREYPSDEDREEKPSRKSEKGKLWRFLKFWNHEGVP